MDDLFRSRDSLLGSMKRRRRRAVSFVSGWTINTHADRISAHSHHLLQTQAQRANPIKSVFIANKLQHPILAAFFLYHLRKSESPSRCVLRRHSASQSTSLKRCCCDTVPSFIQWDGKNLQRQQQQQLIRFICKEMEIIREKTAT